MATDPPTHGNPATPGNPEPPDNPQEQGQQSWSTATLVVAGLVSLATFAFGAVLGIFVLSGSNTGSPNNALACSYFWQFEAAPTIPALVQAAASRNPGTDSSSHFLGEWLNTLEQQVNSVQTNPTEVQSYSKNGTAVGISSICDQLGFSPPGS
jgi:hypothetical protein